MANTDIKKYLGQEALGQLITEIKAADAATLQSAKDYCDSKDKNFEVAGAGATAEANAKAYTDEKIGEVTESLNTVDGKVATEKSEREAADATLQGNIDAVAGDVATNATAIAAINNEETGILAQAKADATSKANAVQAEVDALEELVGTLPEGTEAETVIAYIDAKTANIASDETVSALADRVTENEKDIAAIEADYLKAADKEELATAISTEKSRAEGIEAGLRTDVDAIKGDYLKAEDKTELAEAIAAEAETARAAEKANADAIKAIADDYLTSEDKEELQGGIDTNADAIAAVKADVDAFFKDADMVETAKETLKDIQDYITEHTAEAADMVSAIEKNAKDIADHVAVDHNFAAADATLKAELTEAINGKVAQGDFDAVEGRVEVLEGEMDAVEGRATSLEGRMTTVEGAVATKAEAQDVADAVAALEEADAGQVERIEALEALFGEGEGSVSDQISDAIEAAKEEVTAAAEADATAKANAAEANAKGHADSLNTAMNTRVEALEAIDHDHANKAELDKFVDGDKAKLDDAVAKAHVHANATVLDGISAEKVAAWDASEQNAKDYADGLNTAMTTKVEALEGVVNTKADQEDLEALAEDVEANAEAIAENAAAIAKFVAYTAEEITGMFA